MRSKTLLKGMMALAITTGTACAGSTSVDVPVTIDYSGGCVLNLPASVDLGTVPTIQPQGNGSYLPPISFTVKCTSGVNYSVYLNNLERVTGRLTLTNTADANSQMFVVFAKEDGSYIAYPDVDVVATGTGDETDQTITIYPKLGKANSSRVYEPNSYSCSVNGTEGVNCTQGTYTGTLTVEVSW